MKKVIKIFLGSSITEFKSERADIENFIRRVSDKFEDRYDVKIKPLLCEDFDEALSTIRKQEEYNEKVRSSDMCFFIFFTKAGQYTREEFETAREQFLKTDKPKIYTYFKVLGGEKAEDSLYAFMEELDKTLGHYYGTFEHIDTVKLKILLNLKLQEMDFLEIKVEGDGCTVDGAKMLSLSNVSEFANNRILNELKRELEDIEDEYFALKSKYAKGECSEKEENEYINAASKRYNLINAIEDVQKSIFNMSKRICRDEIKGEITARQKEAYRLFEAGDLEGANSILDFDEIKSEYQRRRAIREAEQKKDAEIFIREGRTKIDVLSAMINRPSRFDEIEEIYREITEVALSESVELSTVCDFAFFLIDQNEHLKAYDILKDAEPVASCDEQTARVYILLGMACKDIASKKDEAEKYYEKATEMYEKLAEEDPEKFEYYLSGCYNGSGLLFSDCGMKTKAEEAYKKAIEIRKRLVKNGFTKFVPDLADSYNNAGIFYNEHQEPEKAEKYYKKAIEIYEELAEAAPGNFEPYLAQIYNNVGVFYNDRQNRNEAEKYYKKAINLREKLARENPERFEPDLSQTYNNIGVLYSRFGREDEAEKYYLKTIEIRKRLVKTKPEIFEPYLADVYNNIGTLYYSKKNYEDAEKYYKEAIVLREKLAQENPARFEMYLVTSYSNMGTLCGELGRKENAEKYFTKAVKICEKLAKDDPEKFGSRLSGIYNNIGALYTDTDKKKAEEYYKKAVAIKERLIKKDAEVIAPSLVKFYLNLGFLTEEDEYFEKALALAKKFLNDPICRQFLDAVE